MKSKMTKELEHLIDRFHKKLDQAQDARYDVMAYIEDHYGIDTHENCQRIEDEFTWCYGIDISQVQELIEEKYSSDNEDD